MSPNCPTPTMRHRRRHRMIAAVLAVTALATPAQALPNTGQHGSTHSDHPTSGTITNDTFWEDTAGGPISSQGGGIFDFEDPTTGETVHYWYGVHYAEADAYRKNPTKPYSTDVFDGVEAYKSTDLVHWEPVGDVLSAKEVTRHDDPSDPSQQTVWVGRLGVAYVPEAGKYALFTQHEYGSNSTPSVSKQVLVATSDSPEGPFTFEHRIDMSKYVGTSNTGDQTVFTDPDSGQSYLVYSNGSGRNRTYISKIGVGADGKIGLTNSKQVYAGAGREGNAMFKYKGSYYLAASDLFGWNASRAYYLKSDSIDGPYEPVNKMAKIPGAEADFGHVTQTGFFYTLRGSQKETVIYAGDRWSNFAGNGQGYNQWVPLSFDQAGTPSFNSLHSWNLNHETGAWQPAEGNNFVVNGEFEADRTRAPYNDKEGVRIPEIAGWKRDDPNVVYNAADTFGRVGNFHITFGSDHDYSGSISQTVKPSGFEMRDGEYELALQVRKPGDISAGTVTATSAGQEFSVDLAALASSKEFTEVKLPVTVKGGEAELKVSISAQAGQELQFDDVSLTRTGDTLPGWEPKNVYSAGDLVSYQGSTWQALWWTKNETPGSDTDGAWQELAVSSAGVDRWTASRVFSAGDVVEFNGATYTAKWWTRGDLPSGASGAWRKN